jgi:hypothetical protein
MMTVLAVPSSHTMISNAQHEYVINLEHVKNYMIFECQPRKNKMFNSNRMDFVKVAPLIDKFISDFSIKKDSFLQIKTELLIQAFAKITARLMLLTPDKIGVELTKSGTLYLFVQVDGLKIHFETFFDHDLKDEQYECVVNVYQNRTQVLSTSGSYSKAVKDLDTVLPSKKDIYLNYIPNNSSYGISSRLVTEEWV